MSSYMPRRWRRISGMSSCLACRMSRSRLISHAPDFSRCGFHQDTKRKPSYARPDRVGDPVPHSFCSLLATGYWLLVVRVFFGQLHLGGFQFLLHPGHVGLIYFRGHGPIPLGKGPLPVCRRQLEASSLLVEVAEMILDRRIGSDALRGLDQGIFRGLELAQLEVGPTQRIEVLAVVPIEIDCFLDQTQGFL